MRAVPHVGMEVRVVHLGTKHDAVVEEVHDDGRTVLVDGVSYELSRLTGHYVQAGGPYYGPRLDLTARG